MHPALRKGPLFTKKAIFHFFYKNTVNLHFFTKKHPLPFHFLPTGLLSQRNGRVCGRPLQFKYLLPMSAVPVRLCGRRLSWMTAIQT